MQPPTRGAHVLQKTSGFVVRWRRTVIVSIIIISGTTIILIKAAGVGQRSLPALRGLSYRTTDYARQTPISTAPPGAVLGNG